MTEEIRYIANLQRQEEFDNEVTELKDELKRLEFELKVTKADYEASEQENKQMKSALEEIREIAAPRFVNGLNEEADLCNLAMDRIQDKINEVLYENNND